MYLLLRTCSVLIFPIKHTTVTVTKCCCRNVVVACGLWETSQFQQLTRSSELILLRVVSTKTGWQSSMSGIKVKCEGRPLTIYIYMYIRTYVALPPYECAFSKCINATMSIRNIFFLSSRDFGVYIKQCYCRFRVFKF
jgi:hypothetical protein